MTTSPSHFLLPVYEVAPFEVAPQFYSSPLLLDAVDVMGFVTENTSLVILVALLITQYYL